MFVREQDGLPFTNPCKYQCTRMQQNHIRTDVCTSIQAHSSFVHSH
jgi:hypothetical protein